MASFSRRIFAPELCHGPIVNRHHRSDSVLHAKLQHANAGGSVRKRGFGTDDGRKERKNERKIRRRNADRRKVEFCRALRVRPLPPP